MRIVPGVRGYTRESRPAEDFDAVTFIDVDADDTVDVEEVVASFQEIPQRLTGTRYLLLRWPQVTAALTDSAESELDARAQQWADTLAQRGAAVGYTQRYTGVVRFRVGKPPVIVWSAGGTKPVDIAEDQLLARAIQVELVSLLEWGHGIWRPKNYHYRLPSGEHAGAFIRVGDAFRSPRDVRAIASWLASRLQDRQSFVADSATLVPLITDLGALMTMRGWSAGRSVMLDEYPRTRLDLMRVIRPLLAAEGGVLGLLSVNSSGRYRDLMLEALESVAITEDSWSLTVLVDKTSDPADTRYAATATGTHEQRVSTWTAIADAALNRLDESDCRWCRDNKRTQLVEIDPRSFEALALPGVALTTPDVSAARRSLRLWDACFGTGAIGVAVQPSQGSSIVSRPKSDLLGVRIHFDRLLAGTDLLSAVRDQIMEARKDTPKAFRFDDCDGVLVSVEDATLAGFKEFFDPLMELVGMADKPTATIDLRSPSAPPEAKQWKRALLFSLGSVTGWTLRQLLVVTQDGWKGLPDHAVAGLAIDARHPTQREWVNLQRSFQNRLEAVWITYLPWRNPLEEEHTLLSELPNPDALPKPVRKFLNNRLNLSQPRILDWYERMASAAKGKSHTPNPTALLWGSPPSGSGSQHVRNQSLYGDEVDAVTCYAAVGAAMHAARQGAELHDPRRFVFELPAISRSYYDGIILACILRWAEPQECWWGATGRESALVMSELLARTQHEGDRKILIPELLLAASQGKVPKEAVVELLAQASAISSAWPAKDQAPVKLGIALLKRASINKLG